MIEIERKFLVLSEDYKKDAFNTTMIIQGFLNTHKVRTVRVRVNGERGYLTVKGESSSDGTSRFEWEKEINRHDAEALLELCEPGIIKKMRHEINVGHHVFEVDEFLDDNQGLVIAEIELNDQLESFEKPQWLGEEVTGDPKYYNSLLSKHPYKQWNS